MLRLEGVFAGYGSGDVLHDINLHLDDGEVITLLGRNGVGKSTTVSTICGLIKAKKGCISLNNKSISGLAPFAIARLGVGLVPEDRHIFSNLTVQENLLVAAANHAKSTSPWTLKSIYRLFPRLEERRNHGGNQLSGGEQQMLAIARALMLNPRLLILDEATEGLAPLICQEIWTVVNTLKDRGQSILIIDKDLDTLLKIADRYYLMEKGEIVSTGPGPDLAENSELQQRYLGV